MGGKKIFNFLLQILFYSVMQEHTGARDGGVRGGVAWRGCGLRAAQKKFSIFFFNFFYLVILLCGGSNMSAAAATEKNQKFSKIFKNFINFQKFSKQILFNFSILSWFLQNCPH
jgi:hypothetical protein